MSNYREKIEAQITKELREWLDRIEERYGPNYEMEAYAFVGAVGFTPEGEEASSDEAFSEAAVGSWCSDSRPWAKIGLLRQALISLESDHD